MQPGLCPGIDARFGLSFLLDFVGCQCNAWYRPVPGPGPGPGPGPEPRSIPFFLKGYCFRVRVSVMVDTNPNPNPNPMDQFMFLGNRSRFLVTVPVLLDRARH